LSEFILEYKDIYLKYKNTNTNTLKDISFKIKEGEFITIIGNSGSGKTTLIKLVNRLLVASQGVILLKGEDILKKDVFELRRNIGYVIQQIGLFPHMTIGENIAIMPTIMKKDKKETSERVIELLELMQLPTDKEFVNRHPWQLSGGQQQRVGLARALCANPEILIMDEPFGALDVVTRKELQKELLSIQRSFNKTIMFVTHDLKEAVSMGDRVMVINDGQIQQFDTPKELVLNPANESVANLFAADTIVKKLQFFNVRDFSELIKPSTEDTYPRITLDDPMEIVTNHVLLGNRYLCIYDEDEHLGNIDCNLLQTIGA
jgi:osmoprotectant transport system ATP-binding protein